MIVGELFSSEIKCRCYRCLCLAMSKCVVVCVCHSYFGIIVLGFYKIHLFLFDRGTSSVVK